MILKQPKNSFAYDWQPADDVEFFALIRKYNSEQFVLKINLALHNLQIQEKKETQACCISSMIAETWDGNGGLKSHTHVYYIKTGSSRETHGTSLNDWC